jgi:hypothetical protein
MFDDLPMIVIASIAAATVFGLAAARYGAETRPGFNELPEARDVRRGLV